MISYFTNNIYFINMFYLILFLLYCIFNYNIIIFVIIILSINDIYLITKSKIVNIDILSEIDND